ncbi:hypothetical protein SAMN05421786_104379 [Chryseobacterium ureilyticum]|uniref:C1q domain-containing protein n=1 Tax=Chryseobacterium ureilyticum TaxID=373668 RepID=A0A1N7P4M4_9FLAO|nr:hypothetical protein SAMN05421786_104379 [Chryseobacterium ureilyticum]
MKTKIYSLIVAFATLPLFSQVGINTSTPAATLDVNGTLKVRDTPAAPALTGYQILGLNQSTTQVSTVDPQLLIAASKVDPTIYAAKKINNVSLLTLGVLGDFKPVNFSSTERTIGSASLFDNTGSAYVIPSTGVYALTYSFRYGTGLQASVLAAGLGIGLVRTRGGVATLIDSRPFTGVSILAAGITISDTTITSLYSFQADDRITFGLLDPGVTLTLLSSSVASFYIYKVSN